MADGAVAEKPKGWRLLKVALQTRKSATMLAFGFSSGLPYALLIGTLNRWLDDDGIDIATIGVLSWIGLSYSFKFLWSPLVDRFELPLIGQLGRRKSWIVLCLAVMIACFIIMTLIDPKANIGWFAIVAVVAALFSATQDVAIDAWRIDVADETAPLDLLSTIYQLGYRVASLVGGAFALIFAARMAWSHVYLGMTGLMVLMVLIAIRAPDTERPAKGAIQDTLSKIGEVDPRVRGIALSVVGLSWAWAIISIGEFMTSMLEQLPPGAKRPSASDFMKDTGPWIVVATVLVPLGIAALMNWLKAHNRNVLAAPDTTRSAARTIMNHMYGALVLPLAELSKRLGWGVLLVFCLILTYRLCDSVWGPLALNFYKALAYNNDQVAFASKMFGVIMTIVGISIGGYLFAKIGRFPTLIIGALLPVFGNLLFSELAAGGAHLDAFSQATGLTALAQAFGSDAKMVRLMLAISGENIATGIAGAAFVAYLSGIVSKEHTAVQYALLSSLTFLIGSLGRSIVAEAMKGPMVAATGSTIDLVKATTVFQYTAAVGLVAVLFVVLEWWRTSRAADKSEV